MSNSNLHASQRVAPQMMNAQCLLPCPGLQELDNQQQKWSTDILRTQSEMCGEMRTMQAEIQGLTASIMEYAKEMRQNGSEAREAQLQNVEESRKYREQNARILEALTGGGIKGDPGLFSDVRKIREDVEQIKTQDLVSMRVDMLTLMDDYRERQVQEKSQQSVWEIMKARFITLENKVGDLVKKDLEQQEFRKGVRKTILEKALEWCTISGLTVGASIIITWLNYKFVNK